MSIAADDIPLHAQDGYNVVVETPRGSRTKFAYDNETGLFHVRKLLEPELAFPFAFGFFPSIHGEDGGPLDVMLLTGAAKVIGRLDKSQAEAVIAAARPD
jgi:inorganic pyrophosphatase